MIINSIEMSYFFRIYQSKKIEFPIDGNKNVIVIKGDNGTGKTTMLSAFSWVFYGIVEEPLTIEKMINKRRLYEMNIGDIENAEVKATISDGGHTYLIKRSQRFRKTADNESVKIGDPEFSVINIANPSALIDKNFFENIIPKDLKGFFFFDGERIDRLAKVDGRAEIRKAILDILGLTTLETIDKAVGEVQSDYNKKIKNAIKNATLKQLRQEYDDVNESLNEDKRKRDGDGTQENPGVLVLKKRAEQEIERCERFLKEHNAEAVKNLQLQRSILEKEQKDIQLAEEREQREVIRHISRNFKYYLLSDRFEEISEFLEEKRRKKELPSDIKAQFVKDLLDSGECICGQKLVIGQCYYERISKLMQTAGREELDNAYITMRAFVESNEINDIAKGFFGSINAYSKRVLDHDSRKKEIENELKAIGKKLSNDFGELIASYEEQLEIAKRVRDDMGNEAYLLKCMIESNESKLRGIEAKIRVEESRQGKKDMYSQAFDLAVEVGRLNEEIRELFIDITREDMDAKIKEVFANISRKEDREACLDESFNLSIRNKVSKKPQILSTGERQITSLAFIGALVSYAKEKTSSDLITDFSGGDFPIVMDSAFGNLDPIHKANVAKGLPSLASQVIVIISDEQWKGTVEENIAERVNAVYNMRDGAYEGSDDEYTEFWR